MKTTNNFKSVPYQGSKAKLLSFLDDSLEHYLDANNDKQIKTFFDAFSGSGQVAYHFKNKFDVITNDKQVFTKVINDTYLSSSADVKRIQSLIDELNNLSDLYFYKTDGWFTQTYSQDFLDGSAVALDGSRKIWLTKNAKKIDMIRTRIDEMLEYGEIVQDEKNVLLTSLLRASNLVANTVGHQNSYLRNWADKALKDLVLLVPDFESNKRNHKNMCGDIFDVLDDVSSDITYFDPPYGSNNKKGSGFCYSAYYHLNNTIVLNNRPELFGKANRPLATKAAKCAIEKNKKDVVMPQFVELVKRSKSNLVCFSYSTQGLLTPSDFEEVFRLGGCDMKTFKVYYTNHRKNKQSQTALKNGSSIERENHDAELYELFIIARKSDIRLVESQTIQEKVETYLQKDVSEHSISDKSYSIYYDNEKGSINEKTIGEISMSNNKINSKRETSKAGNEALKIYNEDVLAVMKSMNDESVDLVVTDPPYKIATGGCKVNGDISKNPSEMLNRGIAANDLKSKWINKSNVDFIRSGSLFKHNTIKFSDWIPEVYRVLKNQTHAYFMVNDRNLNELMTEAIKAGFKLQNVLVWKKNNATPNKYYMKNCEFIVMCRKGKAKNINDMGTKNVLEVKNIIGNKKHPTEKPVELLEILIRNSSKEGDVVFEPFLGAGSTLVAAKNLNRKGVGVEIDEQYFEIAQKRLQPVYEELKQAA
ncbi:DNA methyltransferase [Moritella viscosa]|uniref:site-specific DNA-methyltransferase (adenine-specific) n=1 Tax=Moritella viscosa TaxID=80854 RepID=A0A1L0BBY2_9GAMM|nr:DNA methyltransferase [Moritella viscosa]SGY94927.1 D12 class N6 adenine-specific DNA methyltransferase [Moritella viscosa]